MVVVWRVHVWKRITKKYLGEGGGVCIEEDGPQTRRNQKIRTNREKGWRSMNHLSPWNISTYFSKLYQVNWFSSHFFASYNLKTRFCFSKFQKIDQGNLGRLELSKSSVDTEGKSETRAYQNNLWIGVCRLVHIELAIKVEPGANTKWFSHAVFYLVCAVDNLSNGQLALEMVRKLSISATNSILFAYTAELFPDCCQVSQNRDHGKITVEVRQRDVN